MVMRQDGCGRNCVCCVVCTCTCRLDLMECHDFFIELSLINILHLT